MHGWVCTCHAWLQVAAVGQALSLLDASLEESEDVALALLAAKHDAGSGDEASVGVLSAAVSRADVRAEEVSRMARCVRRSAARGTHRHRRWLEA